MGWREAICANDMIHELASTFPALAHLDDESSRQLEAAARLTAIPAGTTLFRDGAECSNYVLVVSGAVGVRKVAENGREILLYRVEPGQSCVLTTNCLLASENYAAEGIAESDLELLIVPSATFRALLARSEAFREFVFAAYATRISDLLLLIEEVAFGRIDMRLAAWLRQHTLSSPLIHATHQDIATELGTAREVVSRQLKDFERRGLVSLHRAKLEVLNLAGLTRISQAE